MNNKTFLNLTALIFTGVGLVHVLRIVNNWDVVIADWAVPMWISWFAIAVSCYLAYWAFEHGK